MLDAGFKTDYPVSSIQEPASKGIAGKTKFGKVADNVIKPKTGWCPNENSFERSLKRFLSTNLGEAEDKRWQLFEPEGRVLTSPGASLRFVKKRFRPSEKGFGQQPVKV